MAIVVRVTQILLLVSFVDFLIASVWTNWEAWSTSLQVLLNFDDKIGLFGIIAMALPELLASFLFLALAVTIELLFRIWKSQQRQN